MFCFVSSTKFARGAGAGVGAGGTGVDVDTGMTYAAVKVVAGADTAAGTTHGVGVVEDIGTCGGCAVLGAVHGSHCPNYRHPHHHTSMRVLPQQQQ